MADETKVQSPSIEQGGLESPPAPDTDKAPEQVETENLTGPAADSQPEQVAPAKETKGTQKNSLLQRTRYSKCLRSLLLVRYLPRVWL